jgi:hypothetical protein
MVRAILMSAALATLGCATAPAANRPDDKASVPEELPIPHDLRDHIGRSSAIGRQLYVLDKVAAIGTDVLVENIKTLEGKGLGGYIPLREGTDEGALKDSYMVTFFTSDSPPRIAYEIRVAPSAKPSYQAFDPPKAATSGFLALVQARQLAIDAMPPPRQPINPVLLPGEINGEKGVLVYLLAGTKQPNVAVFGQHFRSLVPIGGTSVSYMMPLSKTILEMPIRGPNGEEPEALVITHIVTDFPLETHVFTSLLLKKTVYVGTRRGIWRVAGDEIALIDDELPKGMK